MIRELPSRAIVEPGSIRLEAAMKTTHYGRLAAMAALSFAIMFALMYAMVDTFADVYPSVNQAYMAALMTAPMVILELVLMGSMYGSRKANAAIIAASAVVLAGSWFLIRNQSAIGNEQFLKSMIPHHSGAILMCGKAPVTDADIQRLCRTILAGQAEEIREMKRMLKKTEG